MADLDIPLLVATGALCVLGTVVLDSVTAHHLAWSGDVVRQLIAMGIGLLLMVAMSFVSIRRLRTVALPFYLVALLALVLVRVPGIGQLSHGARRWISIGSLGVFQPSEPAKVALLLLLAVVLARGDRSRPLRSSMLLALALVVAPAVLILLQPDMGTALVMVGTTAVMLFVSGMPVLWMMLLAVMAGAAAPHLMHSYQKARLFTFLNPSADPMGSGYNLIQAQTAVGAGRTWGTGLFAGPMSQHGFVPENWTDFIFSVLGEETGFVGCVGCLALYAILMGLLARTALAARHRFDTLLVSGVIAMMGLHVLVNVGMVLGLVPATGLPLPFASYGGTAVISQMLALGMAMGAYRRAREQKRDLWGLRTADQLA